MGLFKRKKSTISVEEWLEQRQQENQRQHEEDEKQTKEQIEWLKKEGIYLVQPSNGLLVELASKNDNNILKTILIDLAENIVNSFLAETYDLILQRKGDRLFINCQDFITATEIRALWK